MILRAFRRVAARVGVLLLVMANACGRPRDGQPQPSGGAAASSSGPVAEAIRETAQLRLALNPAARGALDRLEASGRSARRADVERARATSLGAPAAASYEPYLLERHQLRLRHWIRDHAIDPTTPADLAQAEQQLTEQLSLQQQTSALQASQRAWLAYRDAWLDLVHALPAPGAPLTLSEVGVRTVLTRERSEELHSDAAAQAR